MSEPALASMVGLVFVSVEECVAGSERVTFTAEDGRRFVFYHSSDCCETVDVNQVDGDVSDLIGTPLVMAEEATESGEGGDHGESWTWTFYKFATVKGYVTVRWLGSSNGYYSERVSFFVEEAA